MTNIARGISFERGHDADEENNQKGKIIIIINRWENMFEILNSEASKVIKRKKPYTEQ